MPKPTLFGAIERPRSLPDEVAQSVMSAIATGALKPGDKLPSEAELSANFNVARTVVREAISLLKFDGVVDSRRGVGAFVANREERTSFRISPACFEKRREIIKLLQLRTSVQSGAAALAAELRSDTQMEVIEAVLQELLVANAKGPEDALEERVEAELRLYRLITAASENEYFCDVVNMIEANIQNYLRSAFMKNAAASEFEPGAIMEHKAVVAAIKNKAPEAARAATRTRFTNASNSLAARQDFA
ncbi:FadR/GntR family transcriptional regulator [Pelagimonas varians]|uniref:HTH-type transcriptional regulator LutR n=1 Tax=Pelagimonas varians TaxID=696760 RepID=A0A238L610_9RHOB|nr:FadR/GntR family transcriptional regulator [Pelagimonas varians]PYG26376.1 GntR family transcriptional regulator [Pelagimonas varians]SMX49822.1 HTH-type transcriptional regulator LutR [Pelagimonas varians]